MSSTLYGMSQHEPGMFGRVKEEVLVVTLERERESGVRDRAIILHRKGGGRKERRELLCTVV